MNTEMTNEHYTIQEKLHILADAAKYDVACTSSGSSRRGQKGELGNAVSCGICHSFAADGRCISLLKILMTNHCVYDCKYCINRASNDVKRATFTPEEICNLTVEFYKRNYIEGLFLSSGILKNPTYTMEKMCAAAGYLADRVSVNLELPTSEDLRKLAPNKTMQTILSPMGKVQNTIAAYRMAIGKSSYMERSCGNQFLHNGIFSDTSKQQFQRKLDSRAALQKAADVSPITVQSNPELLDSSFTWNQAYQLAPHDMSRLKRSFAPAGQSTQMIIGATGESDYTLLQTTQQLYQGFDLKRVFYSAYIPLNEDSVLPEIGTPPPLLREHRLYQADWLLRFYGFQADELLTTEKPNFNELLDPKCDWALRHLELFPVEVETASYAKLLRVPGVGPKSASRIVNARRYGRMDFTSLKKMGVVLKRAHYFITCGGKQMYHTPLEETYITRQLVSVDRKESWEMAHANEGFSQMTLADFGIG